LHHGGTSAALADTSPVPVPALGQGPPKYKKNLKEKKWRKIKKEEQGQ
jgi:hypothetical protein